MVKNFSVGYKMSLADTFTEENERNALDIGKYAYYSNNCVVRVAVWLSGSPLVWINESTLRGARLVLFFLHRGTGIGDRWGGQTVTV